MYEADIVYKSESYTNFWVFRSWHPYLYSQACDKVLDISAPILFFLPVRAQYTVPTVQYMASFGSVYRCPIHRYQQLRRAFTLTVYLKLPTLFYEGIHWLNSTEKQSLVWISFANHWIWNGLIVIKKSEELFNYNF